MTQEEAIRRIKAWNLDTDDMEVLSVVIPELRESEDERIVRCIGTALTDVDEQRFKDFGITLKDCLTYLEKQKEQKSIESVAAEVTKDKESAIKFLKSAGIMDDNGELAEMYRSEQKPAEWSEEDEAAYNAFMCEVVDEMMTPTLGQIKWLRGIRDRLKSLRPQPKQEWSEEDEEALDMCLDAIPKRWKTKSGILLTKWLKDNIHLQSKQEWSEEDKRKINSIIKIICTERECSRIANIGESKKDNSDFYNELVLFIKSLRPSWKPSEKQMDALLSAEIVVKSNNYPEHAKVLAELYEQLKKL